MTPFAHLLAVLLALAPEPRPAVTAAGVLHAWDERRAAAWAAGDTDALRSLYVPGSTVAGADARMLGRWTERGLRVEGLEVQLRCIAVRRATAARIEMVVTDRVARGTVVGRGVRRPLPPGRASTRTIVLRRLSGTWLVDAVRPLRFSRTC